MTTDKKKVFSFSKRKHSSIPAASTAFAVMLACNACPAQAFQASTFLAYPLQHTSHMDAALTPVSLAMRCSSPWDMHCYGDGRQIQPFRRRGGRFGGPGGPRFRRRGGPMIFTPPGLGFLDTANLQVGEPEITDNEQEYRLTFEVPSEVDDENGLDVSVSGRLLTVKAKMTREESSEPGLGPRGRRMGGRMGGGWVSRSSRTDTVSRSFVLPEGVSASGVTTARDSETGKLEVKFNKLDIRDTDTGIAERAAEAKTATVDGKNRSGKTGAASAAASYLSSLSPAAVDDKEATGQATLAKTAGSNASAETTAGDAAPASERRRRPRSVFEALDQEFGDFSKRMWGEDSFRFPTEEEIAARVEAAREARAKRVMAMRRATMTADVFEKDGSYVVRMALPEDATRENVKLTITPNRAVRVSFSPDGSGRSVYKDVRLPRDASFSEISAKFEIEGEKERGQGDEAEVIGNRVMGLEITIGKVVPLGPTVVDIM